MSEASLPSRPAPDSASAAAPQPPRLPFPFARSHGVLLQVRAGAGFQVLYRPGLKSAVLAELGRYLAQDFDLKPVSEAEFDRLLSATYHQDSEAAMQVARDLDSDQSLERLAEEIPDNGDLMEGEEDAPVIRLINALIAQAVREQASDIHIETYEDRLSVRLRIDGVLREVLAPRRLLAPLLVSRIKVMARLDIAEKRLPQDGRIAVRLAGHAVDIRVSSLPTVHGERVVMRLLDKQAGRLELDQLHMPAELRARYAEALRLPHGIILVTGPTGSGKTTTLYAGIMHINDSRQNILTIEDPIEYSLPGVGQSQVNAKTGLGFASGLRAILRQDPDVVMLGEIRDGESARIAVQASLTGHLVLSTLHTNTAVGAITRLQDMGVEPFLLASSLAAVMSQRLVRLLCPDCREAYEPDAGERQRLAHLDRPARLYRAAACARCRHTGYRGRCGIFELIRVDDELRRLIHDGAGEQALLRHARQSCPPLRDSGLRLVLEGRSTLEEVLRVTAA